MTLELIEKIDKTGVTRFLKNKKSTCAHPKIFKSGTEPKKTNNQDKKDKVCTLKFPLQRIFI